jgi:hypothetical protein
VSSLRLLAPDQTRFILASEYLPCHLHSLTYSVDSSEGEEEIDPDAEEEEDDDEGEEEVEDEEEEDMDMDLDSEEEGAKPAPKKPTKATASSKRKPTSAGSSLRNPYPLEGKYVDEDDREQYVPFSTYNA